KQVVALAITAVEVVARAAEPDECDAVLLVDGELAPVVPAASLPPVAFRPRLEAELPFVRNDMENPGELARPHVVGVDVGRWAAIARSAGERNDEEVLEDAPGVAGPDEAGWLPFHRLAQIHTAVVAERGDQLTVLRIDGNDVAALQVDKPT